MESCEGSRVVGLIFVVRISMRATMKYTKAILYIS